MIHTQENHFKGLTRGHNHRHLTILLGEGVPVPLASAEL